MGGKKKAGGGDKKKGKKEGDEEDLSVENFWKAYKKKCAEYQCDISKKIKADYENFLEEGNEIKKFHNWEELGWPGVKAMCEALKQVGYPHCQSIRLWKTYCEDEGLRAICEFIQRTLTCLCLELIDNKITHLGCEFLGRTLKPGPACPPIVFLKLDHNMFGSAGCNALCEGLKTNEMMKTLSLCYCGID